MTINELIAEHLRLARLGLVDARDAENLRVYPQPTYRPTYIGPLCIG